MVTGNTVFADLSTFRVELRAHDASYRNLLKLSIWRPLRDLAVDWSLVFVAVAAVVEYGWSLAPIAVILIANRQRALGNVLHDAGHRNLHRSRWINDSVAELLVAPLVFVDLAAYRAAHLQHDLELGTAGDPDYLQRPRRARLSWVTHYAMHVLSPSQWWGSLVGHLGARHVSIGRKFSIVGWWMVGCWLVGLFAGETHLLTFLLLWMLARGTVFHLITMFREMCDHYGLEEGGVLSFTRNVLKCRPWSLLVHPRNNDYHLTHHLVPAVPYYNLPAAQKLFSSMPAYRARGRACDSYVFGRAPAVRGWAKDV